MDQAAEPRHGSAGDAMADAPCGALEAAPAEGRRRIVLVDDELPLVRVLSRLLADEHEVIGFTDGRDALEWLRGEEPIDAIVCDLNMPNMTGMDLYGRLAESRPELARKMVFMCGGAGTPAVRAFLDRVPNPRIEKPFDATKLRSVLREVV